MAGIPVLPPLELMLGAWMLKKVSIADRVLSLTQAHTQAEQTAAFWIELDHELVPNATAHETATLALGALHLPADIRAAYKLPKKDLLHGERKLVVHLKKSLVTTDNE